MSVDLIKPTTPLTQRLGKIMSLRNEDLKHKNAEIHEVQCFK